jgi:hypothetical protein
MCLPEVEPAIRESPTAEGLLADWLPPEFCFKPNGGISRLCIVDDYGKLHAMTRAKA